MKSPRIHRLGDLQLQILQVLWARQHATVAEVHEALQHRELAYTTIATMLRKMENRGLVRHHNEGRSFVYEPAVAADAVSRSMANHVVDKLYAGSLSSLVNHLLTSRDVSPDELARLEKLIAHHKKHK